MAALGEFTSKAPSELLAAMRAIAEREERDFDAVVEDAMWEYLRGKVGPGVRPEVMAHFYASVEKNRRLMELLARS